MANSSDAKHAKMDETPTVPTIKRSNDVNMTPTRGQSTMKGLTSSLKKNTPESKRGGEKLMKFWRNQIHFLSSARELLYAAHPSAAGLALARAGASTERESIQVCR